MLHFASHLVVFSPIRTLLLFSVLSSRNLWIARESLLLSVAPAAAKAAKTLRYAQQNGLRP
jgi:hypothetical protein